MSSGSLGQKNSKCSRSVKGANYVNFLTSTKGFHMYAQSMARGHTLCMGDQGQKISADQAQACRNLATLPWDIEGH